MDTIKFRGKSVATGAWVYGHYVLMGVYGDNPAHRIIWQGEYNVEYNIIVEPKTVGQFTGIKDKYGKEIYKGDIITNGTKKYEVIWSQRLGGWGIVKYGDVDDSVDLFNDNVARYGEVIGTIYDNNLIAAEVTKQKTLRFRHKQIVIKALTYLVETAPLSRREQKDAEDSIKCLED